MKITAELIEKIKKQIDENFDDFLNLRRHIHMFPELSEHEADTEQFIVDYLRKNNIDFQSGVAGHGVIGTIYGADSTKAIALRGDIDALPVTEEVDSPYKSKNPGVMHACGHDIHTTVLMAAGHILKSMEKQLPQSVKLFFQPSEESIGGARQMIEAGCMQNPDVNYVLGLHVEPSVPCGKVQFIIDSVNAASSEFNVTVTGISCHGAHPDKGIDPLIPACEMVTSLQSVINRMINPTESVLITVGQFNSGTKNNIIPKETRFSGIIRTLSNENRSNVQALVKQLCNSIAEAYGAQCSVTFSDSYPALKNDDRVLELVSDVTAQAIGKDNTLVRRMPSMGADDFAYFCLQCPSLYINVGTQKPGEDVAAPLHSEYFDPDEESIKFGVLTEVLGVLKLMEEENE